MTDTLWLKVMEILDRNAARLGEQNARLARLLETAGAVGYSDMPSITGQQMGDKPTHKSLEEAEGEGDFDPDQQADLIAQILYGLFGDKALGLFKKASDEDAQEGPADVPEGYRRRYYLHLLEWNELDHPRGKGGRFIPKGSGEAVAAAKETVKRVLTSPAGKSPDSAEKVAEHLSILTVKQLKQMAKEHGFTDKAIPKMLRDELVTAIKARLAGSSEEDKGAGKEETPQDPPAAPEVAGAKGEGSLPLTRELASDVLDAAARLRDRRTGLQGFIPALHDAVMEKHPHLTDAQFHAALKAMQDADLGTLQTWGGSGPDKLTQSSGYPIDRFPAGNRSGYAAWFSPRQDAVARLAELPAAAKPPAQPGRSARGPEEASVSSPALADAAGGAGTLNLSSLAPGKPEPVENLRAQSELSKREFDAAVLAAADRGEVLLHRHNAPALLTPQQRNQLVADPNGRDYYGYASRPETAKTDTGGGDVDIPEYPTDAYAMSDRALAAVAGKLGLPAGADAGAVAKAIAARHEGEASPPTSTKPSHQSIKDALHAAASSAAGGLDNAAAWDALSKAGVSESDHAAVKAAIAELMKEGKLETRGGKAYAKGASPPGIQPAAKPTTPKPAKRNYTSAEASEVVRDLYSRATDPQLTPEDIDRQVREFASLPLAALQQVARGFDISRRLSTRGEVLQAIVNKIVDRKGAYERAKI